MPDNARSTLSESEWEVPSEASPVALPELFAALRRSFWTIVGCTLILLLLASAYIIRTPSSYVSSTQLMIEPAKQQLLWQDSNVLDLTVDNAQVESQIEILHSEPIARQVIAKLGLANDPEFRSSAAKSDYQRRRIALVRFLGALSTRRIGQSYVVEISFRSTDLEKSARIANTIAAVYIQDQLHAKAAIARQAAKWLEQRVTKLGVKLNAAAAAVQKFRTENGLVTNDNDSRPHLVDKLTALEARAQAYRKLYEIFVQRLADNEQQQSYPVPDARVIAAASTPLAASYPKTKLILLLAALLGLIGGGLIVVVRLLLDGAVRSTKQVRQALRLPVLAELPALGEGGRKGSSPAFETVLENPFAPPAEALRNIKTTVQTSLHTAGSRRIGVISLREGEGKSTVAAGLAAVFAWSEPATLLIDANVRAPTLSRHLAPLAKRGLTEALKDDVSEPAVADCWIGARILPLAGIHPATPGAADRLAAPAMQRLIGELGNTFNAIIVDLPALSCAADARAIAAFLDGCVLVVEWGQTPLEPLRNALELLLASRVRVLGVVINKVQEGIPPLFGLRLARFVELGRLAYRTALTPAS